MKLVFLCTALVASTPAFAAPLISFNDASAGTGLFARLSDAGFNWAVSWSQTVASRDVTLQALLTGNNTPATANWFVTDRIGAGTTAANVLASGSYTAQPLGFVGGVYDPLERTVLGTGLDFDPGTYFLVLDGPAGPRIDNAQWIGGASTISLANGFSVGATYLGSSPDGFAPATTFRILPDTPLVFELFTPDSAVPEPASWAMMILGFGAVGCAVRFRRYRPATRG